MIKSLEHIKGLWATVGKNEKLSIYINIPFCMCQCRYCLYKGVQGKTEDEKHRFVYDYLIPAIKRFHDVFEQHEIETIYFGGGTPNAIPMEMIFDICDATGCFERAENKILEVHPAFCDAEAAERLIKYGFTLITFGVQSFDEESLKLQKRPYCSPEKIKEMADRIHEYGGKISIDLMCYLKSYAQSDLEVFKKDVELTKQTGVDFATIYPELNLILNDETARQGFIDTIKSIDFGDYYLDDSVLDVEGNPRSITRMIKSNYSYEEFSKKILPYYGNDFPYAQQNIVAFGDGGGKQEVMSYSPRKFFYTEKNVGASKPFYNVRYEDGKAQ